MDMDGTFIVGLIDIDNFSINNLLKLICLYNMLWIGILHFKDFTKLLVFSDK